AFLLAGLWAHAVGADARKPRWLAASAALLSLAVFSKYAAASVLPAAAWYLRRRGFSRARVVLWLAAACALPGAYVLWNTLTGGAVLRGVAAVTFGSAGGPWNAGANRWRALLCSLGGLSVIPIAWPFAARWPWRWAAAAAGALLLLP